MGLLTKYIHTQETVHLLEQVKMAHFAQLDESGVVQRVVVVNNSDCCDENGNESEEIGINFLVNVCELPGIWKQTSYNTVGGVHLTGGTPFRKNYASSGFTYDEVRDAFIPPKYHSSWVLNEETCRWESPVPYPNDGKYYDWNEEQENWVVQE